MKKLRIVVKEPYKLYKKGDEYCLDGDLILLSGVNGSGKSQLLRLISQNASESISRAVFQSNDNEVEIPLEEVLLLSFRDNINLGEDFGQYSIMYQERFLKEAWDYYKDTIKFGDIGIRNEKIKERFEKGLLIENKGIRNPFWRSINKLVNLIKDNYSGDERFQLSKGEIERILPADFVWRSENDIVSQLGNIFYMACCKRVDEQIKCSQTTAVFDNAKWLRTAPWTILNQLFEELQFKYRFKDDYQFATPNIEENPKLRDDADVRSIGDLSDGEKAILKLALDSLDEEISKDIKLVLFDEYDAPLNPSLIEAFYHVIEKFYINKGIQVIIATHSPATISLAPQNTRFYEIFCTQSASPRIIQVDQFEYSELKAANKQFYDRLKKQESRIQELQKVTEEIRGKCLFVEDTYDQIYKIAYLKIKGIEDIKESTIDAKFSEISPFNIYGGFSSGGLFNQLISTNLTYGQEKTIVCLFDFDTEGYKKFEDLEKKKDNENRLYSVRAGTVREGLYLKHRCAERYAMMLPIPQRLDMYVSEKSSSDCFIEIESLLSEEYLRANQKAGLRSEALRFFKLKDGHKSDFWKDLITADVKYFEDFKPLFNLIEKLLKV